MTERVLDRQQKHRLAVLRHAVEVTGNVAATCRYYGISRSLFYTWQRRFDAGGVDGLKARSRRPRTSPNATHTEVVGKIIYLRQNYHFGPGKIAMYLQRYHQVTVSNSGVWRILKRLQMNRLPASQKHQAHDRRWKRYEKQLPGHRVQIDVKFIELPVHRHRRLHPAAGAADLPPAEPTDGDRLRRLRHATAAVRRRGDPDR
jgi:transposase